MSCAPGPRRRDACRPFARFVEGLKRASSTTAPQVWGPLGAWARFCLGEASWLIEPVSRGQEARADRCAATIAGGGAASSALVKVAIVQPLFREVLSVYDPEYAGLAKPLRVLPQLLVPAAGRFSFRDADEPAG